MTVTFENDNNIIVYALEKIISYARYNKYIFVAQCVWWLSNIIGLEQGLLNHIDNLQSQVEVFQAPENTPTGAQIINPPRLHIINKYESRNSESDKQDRILKDCEEFLRSSRAAKRKIDKNSGKQKKESPVSKQVTRHSKVVRTRTSSKPTTEGIDRTEIDRRKAAGECLRCAWPGDRKGAHQIKTCHREIRLEKGTATTKKHLKDRIYGREPSTCLKGSSIVT